MAKQIYIDENGNENLVSGTINNAELLPISSSDATNTKDYIDTALSGKADTSTTYTKTEVDNLLLGKADKSLTNGTMTATSNVTVARYILKKFGNVTFITCAIYVSVNHNAGAKLASLSITPTKMVDLVAVAKPNQTACAWNVDTDGYLYTNDSMVTGQTYYVNGWYI